MSDVPRLPAGDRAAEHLRASPPMGRVRLRLLPLAVVGALAVAMVSLIVVGVVRNVRAPDDNAAPGVAQTFAAPRSGTAGKIELTANAATVLLRPLAIGNPNLLQGTYTPGKDRGDALLQHKGDVWVLSEENGAREPADSATWEIGLATDVALDLTLLLNATSADLNLQGVTLASLSVEANAGTVRATLPANYSGDAKAAITANAGGVQLTVPAGAAVRLMIETRAGSRDVSPRFIARDGGYETPEFATAKNRLTVRIKANAGRVTVQ